MRSMRSRSNKRGQGDAGNAALVVLIILVTIIIYVLLVPGPVRDELLNGPNATNETGSSTTSGTILLQEHPGTIDIIKERGFIHTVPSFNLYKTTDSVELKKVNPFYIKRDIFSEKKKTILFDIKDIEHTNGVLLSFDASTHQGILIVKLNGEIVFEGEVSSFNVNPITLEQELLRDKNEIEFSVSGVGWQFWRVNTYSLENIRVIGELTDISRQEAKNIFQVTRLEHDNVDRIFLKFNPDCNPSDVGRLYVDINSNPVFTGVPDCGILNVHELSPDALLSGDNKVVFRTEKGSYLVDLISIETKLKENPSPVYYFEISNDDYSKIESGRYNLTVVLEFADKGDLKEGTFTINGHDLRLYTTDRVWERSINAYVTADQNAIKLTPKETLYITKLLVKIRK